MVIHHRPNNIGGYVPEYRVVYSGDIDKLQKAVNDLLKEDWQPTGGICVVCDNDQYCLIFYQSLVKIPLFTLTSTEEATSFTAEDLPAYTHTPLEMGV